MQQTILPGKFTARVPVVATLKIGEVEQVGGKARPKKLDHMRICGASSTAQGTYPDHPEFAEFNKRKPREITIELVSDDPRVNLDIVYTMAGRGAILCRGNGVEAERRVDPRGTISADVPFQKVSEGTCGENCPFFKTGACKLASTLRFRVPAGLEEGTVPTPLGSVVQYRSTSWNTGQDLLGAMEAIKAMTGGTLARIPLRLFMTEQHRQALTSSGRTNTNFWTLGLAFPGEEAELVTAVTKALKTKADMANLAIPTLEERLKAQGSDLLRDDLSADEQLAIAAEYFPALPTRIPAVAEGAGATQAEAGKAVASPVTPEGPKAEESKPEPVPAQAPAQPEAPATPQAAPAAPPAATAERGMQVSQRNMIIRYAGQVKGIDMPALKAILDKKPDDGGWTYQQTRAFINDQLLKGADEAMRSLGVVKA